LPGVAQELKDGATLATLKPLKIQALADVNSALLTAYKPSYDLATAKNALDTAGVFEGPISLFALDPSPVDTDIDKTITGVTAITWKLLAGLLLVNLEKLGFSQKLVFSLF
jgi:hypothetical protein